MRKLILNIFCIFLSTFAFGQDALELMEKGNAASDAQNWTEAIKYYNQALTLNPTFSTALVMKGLCFLQIDQTDSACGCFVNGIEIGSEQSKKFFPKYCGKYKPNLNTDKFKTGKFIYPNNSIDSTAFITRDDKYQIEYFQNSKYSCKSLISWKNTTEYQLKFIETNDPNLDFLKKGDKIKVRILKFNGDEYFYQAELNGIITYAKQRVVNN